MGDNSSTPQFDASEAVFRSTQPAVVAGSLADDGGSDGAPGHAGLSFPAGTFFFS